MKTLLHEWAFKTLTIFDKVTVVKTVPLSVLVQCICVLHCPKPQEFKEIKTKLKWVKSSAYSFFCYVKRPGRIFSFFFFGGGGGKS